MGPHPSFYPLKPIQIEVLQGSQIKASSKELPYLQALHAHVLIDGLVVWGLLAVGCVVKSVAVAKDSYQMIAVIAQEILRSDS